MPVTTAFRPNSLTTEIAYVGASGYRRATCGGCALTTLDGIATTLGNETGTPWYGDSTVAIVGAARDLSPNLDYRARAMFRFVLRDQTIAMSSIQSGTAPEASWWPLVTAARLVWWNGDSGGLQGVSPRTITTDSLLIRVGRGLYTPTGANEQPFGSTAEAGASMAAALTFGSAEATLAWATWQPSDRAWITHALSATAVDTYLKTITGATNDYLDVSFYLSQEGVEGIDILREIGAWEPFPPRLEIDFNVSAGTEATRACATFRASGEAAVVRASGEAVAMRSAGEAEAVREDGQALTFRQDGESEEVWR